MYKLSVTTDHEHILYCWRQARVHSLDMYIDMWYSRCVVCTQLVLLLLV